MLTLCFTLHTCGLLHTLCSRSASNSMLTLCFARSAPHTSCLSCLRLPCLRTPFLRAPSLLARTLPCLRKAQRLACACLARGELAWLRAPCTPSMLAHTLRTLALLARASLDCAHLARNPFLPARTSSLPVHPLRAHLPCLLALGLGFLFV